MITAATLIKRNDACREGSRIYKTKGGDKDASLPPSLSLSHIIFTFLSPFLLPSFSGLTLLLLYLFIVHTHTYCPVNICTVGDAATRSVFIVNMSVCVCVCSCMLSVPDQVVLNRTAEPVYFFPFISL